MNQSLTLTGSPGALAAALAAFASYDSAADAPTYTPVANVPEPTKVVEIPASAAPVYVAGVVEPTAAPVYTPVMPEVAAAAPTIPGEPEFDSSGLAWDGRIHSAQKGTTKDGKWRKKRDVADPYYNAVEAELRAAYGHPAPHVPVAAAAPAPVPIPLPVMTQPMPIPVMPVQGNAPMPMAQPSEPAPMVYGAVVAAPVASEPIPAMPVATAEPTMHDIMSHVGQNMPTGLITPDYLVALTAEINQQHGLAMQSFSDMAANPGAIAYAWAAFQRDGKR